MYRGTVIWYHLSPLVFQESENAEIRKKFVPTRQNPIVFGSSSRLGRLSKEFRHLYMSVKVLDSVEIECRMWSRTHKVFGVVGSLRCIELLRWFRGGALNFCEELNRLLQTSSMAERLATATQKKKCSKSLEKVK